MTAAELCREAARIVAEGDEGLNVQHYNGACYALNVADGFRATPTWATARNALAIFNPRPDDPWQRYWWPRTEKYRNARILALLFAAAMLEDE